MVTVSDQISRKVTNSDREKVVYLYSINRDLSMQDSKRFGFDLYETLSDD